MLRRISVAAGLVGVLFCGGVTHAAAPAEGPVYAVIIDDDLPDYRRVLAGIAVETRGMLAQYSLRGDASLGPDITRRVLQDPPAAIITLGPKSLAAAKAATSSVPIIFCMVPGLERFDVRADNVAGVRLEPSYDVRFEALSAVLPDVKKLAVVYSAKAAETDLLALRRAADAYEIEIVDVEVDGAKAVFEGLSGAGPVDGLMMIADPAILNVAAFEAAVAFAQREKVALFALSNRFVERGALIGFGSDYAQMGRQVARLAAQVKAGEVRLAKVGVLDPDGLVLGFNRDTALAIGAADVDARVLAYAARHRRRVQVFSGADAQARADARAAQNSSTSPASGGAGADGSAAPTPAHERQSTSASDAPQSAPSPQGEAAGADEGKP